MGFRRDIGNLTIQKQEVIVNGRSQGRTPLELGKQFNISDSGISKFLKRWIDQGGVPKFRKSGRPRSTSRLFGRNVLRLSRVNTCLTAVDIARERCDPPNPKPSVRTIRRRLQGAGLNGRRQSRNRLYLRRIARRVWNGRRCTSTGPRKIGKISFVVMKANTCCLVRMGYNGFVVLKTLVSTPNTRFQQ
ncbi:hypothetical protein AVEN_96342-1 [Araneus ventricosus]|uniref:Transposase Tc1-like domain-containing protein n=1 Tax=Araneus ventricosus TaxID=182803 RepID=A0A4Y2TV34_ARAVE|nr:hypothetical protein AVEN_96342-1 [Araneus ventricosus]